MIILCIVYSCLCAEITTYGYDSTKNSIGLGSVYAIAVDKNNTLWCGLGRDAGISVLSDSVWTTYKQDMSVLDIAIDNDDNKWFCARVGMMSFTRYIGVLAYNGHSWITYDTSNGLVDNTVMSLGVDKNNTKWFAMEGFGVSAFDGTSWRTYTENDGLACNGAYVIVSDREGSVWFGTPEGISVFNGTSWTTYDTSDGLINNKVFALAFDNEGCAWIGTDSGVSTFDGTKWKSYTSENSGLVNDQISAIAITNNGTKWVGTEEGIFSFDGTEWTTWLGGRLILSMAVDCVGNVWAGTSPLSGLYKISLDSGNAARPVYRSHRENEEDVSISINDCCIAVRYTAQWQSHGTVFLYTMQGECIRQSDFSLYGSRHTHMMNTSDLPNGSYIVQVRTGDRVVRERILLVR